MRNTVSYLGAAALLVCLGAGCKGPEEKMGRGLSNMAEPIRMGELQRGIEQGGLLYGSDTGITTGFISGLNHTLARTGVGIYEVVTFPFPPYRPVCTSYLTPYPGYPDAYKPGKPDRPVFDTDHALGFSGGDWAPWFPGSRFRVFDN
jgi:putative exosortase-associated protein (TIGR04073 family)